MDSLWIHCVADPDSVDSYGSGYEFLINPQIRIIIFSYETKRNLQLVL